MLHSGRHGRQVHGWLLASLLSALAMLACPAAHASRSDDLATADTLARGGQPAAAAELYESLAKRPFRAASSSRRAATSKPFPSRKAAARAIERMF